MFLITNNSFIIKHVICFRVYLFLVEVGSIFYEYNFEHCEMGMSKFLHCFSYSGSSISKFKSVKLWQKFQHWWWYSSNTDTVIEYLCHVLLGKLNIQCTVDVFFMILSKNLRYCCPLNHPWKMIQFHQTIIDVLLFLNLKKKQYLHFQVRNQFFGWKIRQCNFGQN